MSRNAQPPPPPGRRGSRLFLGLLVFAGAAWALYQLAFPYLEETPGYLRHRIHNYLKRNANLVPPKAVYDYDIRQSLARMDNELAELQAEIKRRETNLVASQREIAKLRSESLACRDQARSLRASLVALEETATNLERQQNRLAAEYHAAETVVMERETSVAAARGEVAGAQSLATALSNEIAVLQAGYAAHQTNLAPAAQSTNLSKADLRARTAELAAEKKNLAHKEDELRMARQKLARANELLANREASLNQARTKLLAARTQWRTARENLAAKKWEIGLRHSVWLRKLRESGDKSALADARQKEWEKDKSDLAKRQAELTQRQKERAHKEQEAAAQTAAFIKEVRRQMASAATYAAMYALIAEQLRAADYLLAQPDPAKRREGIWMALEAGRHALETAENFRLAGRICEAYLLPNLKQADPPGESREQAGQLLKFCLEAFHAGDETNQIVRCHLLQIEFAADRKQADAVRYSLANELAALGQYQEALTFFQQIQSPDYAGSAQLRMNLIKKRMESNFILPLKKPR